MKTEFKSVKRGEAALDDVNIVLVICLSFYLFSSFLLPSSILLSLAISFCLDYT